MLIGTEITLVTGNDVDSSPALSYSLQLEPAAAGMFGIHRYSGGISLTAPLDFEEQTWYTLTVRATDSRHHAEANVTILIEDVNDNVPTFTHDLYQVGRPAARLAASVCSRLLESTLSMNPNPRWRCLSTRRREAPSSR